MSQQLSDVYEGYLYLDTNILYEFLVAGTPATIKFFEQIEQGHYQVLTSILTFDELSYRLLLKSIRDHYGGSPLDHYRQDGPKMIDKFLPKVKNQLNLFRYYTTFTIVDVSASDFERMLENMELYHLKPRDALHLAAMQRSNCDAIVTNDADFDHIPEIQRYLLE